MHEYEELSLYRMNTADQRDLIKSDTGETATQRSYCRVHRSYTNPERSYCRVNRSYNNPEREADLQRGNDTESGAMILAISDPNAGTQNRALAAQMESDINTEIPAPIEHSYCRVDSW